MNHIGSVSANVRTIRLRLNLLSFWMHLPKNVSYYFSVDMMSTGCYVTCFLLINKPGPIVRTIRLRLNLLSFWMYLPKKCKLSFFSRYDVNRLLCNLFSVNKQARANCQNLLSRAFARVRHSPCKGFGYLNINLFTSTLVPHGRDQYYINGIDIYLTIKL